MSAAPQVGDPRRWAVAAQALICIELPAQFALVLLGDDHGTTGAVGQAVPAMTLLSCISLIVVAGWLRRCRLNAEVFAPGSHRYRPGFAIGGWFIPVAMLWIPRRVTLDVRRASGLVGGAWLVEGWWWARLLKVVIALACTRWMANPLFSPYVALCSAVSGILLFLAIREITTAQVTRLTPRQGVAAATAA
ncbi:DUF4328 domain-containing protein [Kitasatospora herbaricolor]|uniref:DUF4328 domain-containing protein n=1 Tax=Kitasatospora herbaricolor TaxID=68217 RepID=UPI0036D91FA5